MILTFKDPDKLILADERVRLVAEPQVPFNRARLRVARGWKVHDLRFGNYYQAASSEGFGDMSEIFEGDGLDLGQLNTCTPGMLVTLDVTNLSGEPRRFEGALVVSMVDPLAVASYVITVTSDGVNVKPILREEQ